MLPLLGASDLRLADAHTLATGEGMRSWDLMERASQAFTDCFCTHYATHKAVCIFCGQGGNGGDGLAIARLLAKRKYTVSVFVLGRATDKGTEDFLTNLKKWQALRGSLSFIASVSDVEVLKDTLQAKSTLSESIVIDALFGYGLNRPITGLAAALVRALNELPMKRIAVDMPSGLFIDKPLPNKAICLSADHVISFQTPKLAFLLPENEKHVKRFSVVDIGLSKAFIASVKTPYVLTEATDLHNQLPVRNRHAHKGTAGHGLLVAGKKGMYGAAVLAARAAMRTGIGLITVHVPKEATSIIHNALPEALVSQDNAHTHITKIPLNSKYDAIAIGPGIGSDFPTAHGLREYLQNNTQSLIMDADALNLSAAHPQIAKKIPKHSILTPHAGELKRIIGQWKNDYEKLNKLRQLARKWKAYIVLKGPYSAVTYPNGEIYFNPSGHSGMATAGSGDVLTGILLGLAAQGMQPAQALRMGVYLHGRAGNIAAKHIGERPCIASDLIQYIPHAIMELENKKT